IRRCLAAHSRRREHIDIKVALDGALVLGRTGFPLITGRQPSPPPVRSILLSRFPVPRVPIESGEPLWNRVTPEICQPSNTCLTNALFTTRLRRGRFQR